MNTKHIVKFLYLLLIIITVANIQLPDYPGGNQGGSILIFPYLLHYYIKQIVDGVYILLLPSIILFVLFWNICSDYRKNKTLDFSYLMLSIWLIANSLAFLSEKKSLFWEKLDRESHRIVDVIAKNTNDSTILSSSETSALYAQHISTKTHYREPFNNVTKAHQLYFAEIGFDTLLYKQELRKFKYPHFNSFAYTITKFAITSGKVSELSFPSNSARDKIKQPFTTPLVTACMNYILMGIFSLAFVIIFLSMLFRNPPSKSIKLFNEDLEKK